MEAVIVSYAATIAALPFHRHLAWPGLDRKEGKGRDLRTRGLEGWRTGGLEDWRTGGLGGVEDWRTGGQGDWRTGGRGEWRAGGHGVDGERGA